ncbi:MAG TPA: reverse transcriptase/maturase family protein [Polyangium sp.]|nr:reverse transcriptase/maturase family protein [Polyangium sp.]
MPRRSAVSLGDIASMDNLTTAFWEAARGKRLREDVWRFEQNLPAELARLADDIREGRSPDGHWSCFRIYDPKPRRILAPSFRDRVLHHALMQHVAPVLERGLVDDTFACREGKGTLAAVYRAQTHLRRFPYFVKADVRAYFASIDHAILRRILARRFKNPGVLALFDRILERTPDPSGRGLPIGALTSQWFANVYLDGLDRFLLEHLRVPAMVRYMDDFVFWCHSRKNAMLALDVTRSFLHDVRHLEIKTDGCPGRSCAGVAFLGFRVLPGSLRLSLRRRRRYAAARARWEEAWQSGGVDACGLQAGYASALAMTAHADARGFRRANLQRRKPVDA